MALENNKTLETFSIMEYPLFEVYREVDFREEYYTDKKFEHLVNYLKENFDMGIQDCDLRNFAFIDYDGSPAYKKYRDQGKNPYKWIANHNGPFLKRDNGRSVDYPVATIHSTCLPKDKKLGKYLYLAITNYVDGDLDDRRDLMLFAGNIQYPRSWISPFGGFSEEMCG